MNCWEEFKAKMAKAAASPPKPVAEDKAGTVMFLPWLRLSAPEQVGRILFSPFRVEDRVDPAFADVEAAVITILSSYRDLDGTPIENAVIVSLPERSSKSWSIEDKDFPEAGWAVDQLFLAAFASNQYLDRGLTPYVNSTTFDVVGQKFSSRGPVYVGLSTRRRDGNTMDGGYQHGEIVIGRPMHVSLREPARVDRALLTALEAAGKVPSAVVERLRTALPFFSLGNTDSPTMSSMSEAILIVSAYEQLLDSGKVGKALALAEAFGDLFQPHGSVRVIDAMASRPDISIAADDQQAQEQWWLHKKWAEEFHTLRSKSSHIGHTKMRSWGWNPAEHLLMAAWAFPLAVKVLLEREGHYQLTDADRTHCRVIDEILSLKSWTASADEDYGPSVWSHTIQQTRLTMLAEEAWAKIQAKIEAAKQPEPIGTVTRYYAKPRAAIVSLTVGIKVGEHLRFVSGPTSFEQELRSLRLEDSQALAAAAGTEVGIVVDQVVDKGWTVFRIQQ